jgi:hypothetical protein
VVNPARIHAGDAIESVRKKALLMLNR